MTMLERLNDYDWKYAFQCCGVEPKENEYSGRYNEPSVSAMFGWTGDASEFTREDVAEILAISDGENDGPDWIGLFRLKDGRIAFLSAGCDYTGWDCQSGGHAIVGGKVQDMITLGMGDDDRARLAEQLELLK